MRRVQPSAEVLKSYWREAQAVGNSGEHERALFCAHQGSRAWSCKILGSLCISHTVCHRARKEEHADKTTGVQFASSFIVILILFIAGCVRSERVGLPLLSPSQERGRRKQGRKVCEVILSLH